MMPTLPCLGERDRSAVGALSRGASLLTSRAGGGWRTFERDDGTTGTQLFALSLSAWRMAARRSSESAAGRSRFRSCDDERIHVVIGGLLICVSPHSHFPSQSPSSVNALPAYLSKLMWLANWRHSRGNECAFLWPRSR